MWSNECVTAMDLVYAKYNEIDFYDIYAPICLSENKSSSQVIFANKVENNRLKRANFFSGGYDPCYSNHAEAFFNRKDVQTSLHVNANRGNSNTTVKWNACNDSILNVYNITVPSVLPVYKKLIQGGLKIWIYSGDVDGRVPVIGTRYCVEALGLPIKTPWRSWYHQRQVGGRLVEYEGLTLVTVRGAGHLVPLNKPSEALALIHSFLTGEDLPARR